MMRKGVVGPLAGLLATGATGASAAVGAAAASQARTFLSGSRVKTPLSEPLPGLVLPASEVPSKPPTTEVTTLSNGAKVASENTPGATATIGVYAEVGSVNEDASTTGASHLLEYLAFRGTSTRSHLRLVREVEAIGGAVLASAGREQTALTIDAPASAAAAAAEILVDSALNPAFKAHEVKAAAARLAEDSSKLEEVPQTLLLEGAHAAAFKGALGLPLVAPPGAAASLTPEALEAFHAAGFAPSNLVVAAAGVEHQALLDVVGPLLESVPASSAPAPKPESSYIGGDWRQSSSGAETHALLAFSWPGGWRDVQGSVEATVAQYLLGGGGSFSAGGPGKGMHSLLHRKVLNQYGWVSHASALSSIYNTTGLLGIYASGDSARAGDLVAVLADQLGSLATAAPAAEVARAKAAAKSSVLFNLESRAVVAEDVGRQVLTYGERKPLAEFLDAIDAVTPESLAKAFAAALKSPPTLAVYGNTAAAPRYDVLAKHFA